MILEDEFGKRTYYYYKKKIGRPKKRGPKKKPKKRGRSWQEKWNFKLVKCLFNKQIEVVGIFHNIKEVDAACKLLKARNEKVDLPVKYIVDKRNSGKILENKSEYVILERIRDNSDNTTVVKNDFGKFVEHTTTNSNWKIYDKFPACEEEAFWVYGFNPKRDRKNYKWIIENLLLGPINESQNMIIRVVLFYNKVIIRYDIDDLGFVICKNESDAIRLYNKIGDDTKKIKQIVETGRAISKTDLGETIINLLKEKTGWPRVKITRKKVL